MRNRFWLGLTGLVAVLALTLLLPNCGRAQVLASIDVQPDVETFGDANTPVSADAGLNVQLRALGNYAHPPITKDITSKVTWASNTPGIATVDATGLLTALEQTAEMPLSPLPCRTTLTGMKVLQERS